MKHEVISTDIFDEVVAERDRYASLLEAAEEEREEARARLAEVEEALERLQLGPGTLTQDGLSIVIAALYPDSGPRGERPASGFSSAAAPLLLTPDGTEEGSRRVGSQQPEPDRSKRHGEDGGASGQENSRVQELESQLDTLKGALGEIARDRCDWRSVGRDRGRDCPEETTRPEEDWCHPCIARAALSQPSETEQADG